MPVRREMDSVRGLVALCVIGSYHAIMSSSDAEEAADVHGDAACENALVYDSVPSVDDAPINGLSMVVRSGCRLDETNIQDALRSPLEAAGGIPTHGRIR